MQTYFQELSCANRQTHDLQLSTWGGNQLTLETWYASRPSGVADITEDGKKQNQRPTQSTEAQDSLPPFLGEPWKKRTSKWGCAGLCIGGSPQKQGNCELSELVSHQTGEEYNLNKWSLIHMVEHSHWRSYFWYFMSCFNGIRKKRNQLCWQVDRDFVWLSNLYYSNLYYTIYGSSLRILYIQTHIQTHRQYIISSDMLHT